ncbi:dihydrolipoyl dehydrogenase [Methanobrevibacter cuticularis]|uniref:Dihydrolipoyl dehydrogenase n=1 Tax=Methanobrevibacter cuticularis TaxID=47311 RepID=A0A166DN93_9EURY|nr:NAD(P)/FAD-dependent oxidoreductase [Methanobrevibacter cuticularis]KZX15781.1 dihydrolipoyl dehydrogenase [Methanobrevibacter cuticularis]
MKNIIIGAGPAGRLAGLELGKLEKEVLLIEKEKIGGNCLNEGCMVVCALTDIGRFLNNKRRYEKLGLLKGDIEISYSEIVNKIRKVQEIIREFDQNENEQLNNDILYGEAKVDENSLSINGETYTYENLLIATGSKPFIPEVPGKEHCLTNKDLLKIKKIPEKLTIIGGGAIAAEISSLFASFGSQVKILTRGKFLNDFDPDLRDYIIKKLLKNVKIYEDEDIIEIKKDKVISAKRELEGTPFAATGRLPNSDIAKNFLELNNNGAIKVNEMMQTSVPNVYAAGDVIGGINLTTVARMEGITAARNMAGYLTKIDYKTIPQSLTLDMDVGFTIKYPLKGYKESEIDSISLPGSAGFGGFWRVLTQDTGLTKVTFDKNKRKLESVSAISPSSCSDVAYMSYLMRIGENMDDIDEFIEIHPSTDVFHKIIKDMY